MKRIISLLLCVVMLLGLSVPGTVSISNAEDSLTMSASIELDNFYVYSKEGETTSIAVPQDGFVALTAPDMGYADYRWQILAGDIWVNIQGETDEEINLSYAMVANLMTNGEATVRCVTGDLASYPVSVTVAEAPEYESDDTFERPVAEEDPEVIDHGQEEAAARAEELYYEIEALQNDVYALEDAYAEAQDNTAAAQDALDALETTDADADETLNEQIAEQNATVSALEEAYINAQAETEAAQEALDAADPEDVEAVEAAQAALDEAEGNEAEAETAWDDAKTVLDELTAELEQKEADVADNEAMIQAAQSELSAAQEAEANAKAALDEAEALLEELLTEYYACSGIGLMAADEENQTYSVVINYVFKSDGEPAANQFTAVIAAGKSLNVTVKSPSVMGYVPDQETVTINETDIQADITKNVYYEPTEVPFIVKHYKQNLDNDEYDKVNFESETITNKKTEDSVGKDLEKDYEGFYALLYEDETKIAADGSTVVEIYYDRIYYLMNFNLDGGYGVEPIYARYGAPINVGTPSKAGYTFGGWMTSAEATETVSLPSTMPAISEKKTTYYAKWVPHETATVTVVFWGQNPNDNEYSYDHTGTVQVTPGTEFTFSETTQFVICGDVEHSHSEDCTYECGKTEHTHDASCGYACGKSEHTHSENCYNFICQQKVHTHSDACCGNEDPWHWWHSDDCCKENLNSHTHSNYTGSCYTLNCQQDDHSHDAECGYSCGEEAHTHSEERCGISCGLTAHIHSSDCYQNGAGMSTELWTFVRSDTVTVAADGSSIVNVYYNRTVFTLRFRKANSSQDDYGTIVDRWGANIGNRWTAKNTEAKTTQWSENRNAYSPWTSYWEIMPSENRTYYAYEQEGESSTAIYYTQSLNGEYTEKFTITAQGSSTFTVTIKEDFFDLEGFTRNLDKSSKEGDYFNGAKFYYDRNSYKLEFMSSGTKLEDKSATVKYEAPLTSYNFTPEYPSNLEPNAYRFDGWFYNQYFAWNVNWEQAEMPASDMILYASWVPVNHTVDFYLTEDDTNTIEDYPRQTVAHGSTAKNVKTPERGEYDFVGWFYRDENDTEHAFDLSMPVTRDLRLYAKWSSNKIMEFTIRYALDANKDEKADVDDEGNVIYIADKTTASGLAGSTKTYDAKGGSDLYDLTDQDGENYQVGYFPVTNSHSLIINIEGNNDYTFLYIPSDSVQYTVYYLTETDPGNNLETVDVDGETYYRVAADKNENTRNSIVTEFFVPVAGYMPTSFQQRLVLSADETENVLIFWYEVDNSHAPVVVYDNYRFSEGTNYREELRTQLSFDLSVGSYTAAPLTNTPGYEFEKVTSTTFATDADVTDHTLENGTVSIEVTSDGLRIDFYYIPDVQLNYEVVGPEGCGTVTLASEKVKAVTGTPFGSTATATDNFRFVGWYANKDCTGDPLSTDATYVPTKDENALWIDGTTYYAKFEYNLTSMTIAKSKDSGVYDDTDIFIFDVYCSGSKVITVTLKKGEEVTISGLTVGEEYTVKERTTGTRYNTHENKTLTAIAGGNNVIFENSVRTDKWLSVVESVKNVFNGVTRSTPQPDENETGYGN